MQRVGKNRLYEISTTARPWKYNQAVEVKRMTATEQNLETQRTIFLAHKNVCDCCRKVIIGQTGTLSYLCQKGTVIYKELLKAERDYLSRQKGAEQSAKTRKYKKQQLTV